jgi:putative transposase
LLPGKPVPVADTSISGVQVARELDALVRLYGKPACMVSDNVLGREAMGRFVQQVSMRRQRPAQHAF